MKKAVQQRKHSHNSHCDYGENIKQFIFIMKFRKTERASKIAQGTLNSTS